MSDTPRTDAALDEGYLHITDLGRMRKHAEQLERELNQWKACCELFYDLDHIAAFSMYDKLKGVKP